MEELRCPLRCKEITTKNLEYFTFNEEDFLSKEGNFCLADKEDLALAEEKGQGVYWVHLCFSERRGKEAILLAERMLEEFIRKRPVKTMIGLIHDDNKKAKVVARKVGFKSLGSVVTKNGPCEMFFKGIKSWE